MNRKLLTWSRRYQAALRTHLSQDEPASLESARGLGAEGLAAGLQVLELAKIHEGILVSEILPVCPAGKRASLIKRAGQFFAVAVTPNEQTLPGTEAATTHLKETVELLSQRTVELAASNLELSREITRRKAVEAALKKRSAATRKRSKNRHA